MTKWIKLSKENQKILLIFLSWKILLIFVLFFSIKFVPLAHTDRFLGAGPIIFQISPELFSWANFDGEHYLSISMYGYKALQQAFFPVFPLLISFFSLPFSNTILDSIISHTIVGLIISNVSFLLALYYLFKLIKIDYSKKVAFLTLIFLVSFPTSFYFGSLYNESLFLLLAVLTFLNARKGNWFLASIFAAVASATRVFGVLLFLSLIVEAIQQKAKSPKILWILLSPLGLLFYMVYQYISVNDFLAFYNLQTIVGSQHQSGIILLPQVYFRYFKLFLSLNKFDPQALSILVEFFTGALFFILPIIGFLKKVRFSYLLFTFLGFILPTIQGSFSSLPRYVMILFPSFLIMALIIENYPRIYKYLIFILLIFMLIVESSLFFRVYWVA